MIRSSIGAWVVILQLYSSLSFTPRSQLSQVRWAAQRSSFSMSSVDNKAMQNPVLPSLANVPYRINQLVPKELIECIRFRYITVATEQLAQECRTMLSTGKAEFGDLAKLISLDPLTSSNGGLAGWINVESGGDGEVDSAEKSLYPPEVANKAFFMNKGDICVVSSPDSQQFHIVQLVDIQTKLSPQLLQRRKVAYWQANDLVVGSGSDGLSKQQTYYIDTMGCQMNVADSERMEGQLAALGMTKSPQIYHAHDPSSVAPSVVILNTCSIRDHAEQKVYSYLGPHALRKRKGDKVCIIVAGCVAQQEGAALLRRFPEIDIVMGPQYAPHLTELLIKVADGHQVVATEPINQFEHVDAPSSQNDGSVRSIISPTSAHSPLRRSDVTAFVNIIYGCNERCTYCVVPTTRGVEQSRTLDAVLAEVKDLVGQGYKEVTLLGQNIDSWGRDFAPKQRFADLLSAVGQVAGLERVRFLTSHPKYMSQRVIDAVASNPTTVMPNFNIPFQSGSDRVLRNMRRGYTRQRYAEIVKNIRAAIPDASITADCIVGFPGETEGDFQETLDLMTEIEFDVLNTAAYSARPHTPAADWENGAGVEGVEVGGEGAGMKIPEKEKQGRLRRINELAEKHALRRSQRFLNRTMPVLVEELSLKNPSLCVGRIPHNRLCYFVGDFGLLKGKTVDVFITEAKAYSLVGKMVEV